MADTYFKYEGHSVAITLLYGKKGRAEYWIIIDGRPVFFVGNPDTAKRLATRFIDTFSHPDFQTSRQGKTFTQPTTH